MLSEFHQTPHQVNYEWTEEQIALYFRKRNERMKRMAEEIEKMRGNHDSSESRTARRVSSADFLARIQKIQASGGHWAHGMIQ